MSQLFSVKSLAKIRERCVSLSPDLSPGHMLDRRTGGGTVHCSIVHYTVMYSLHRVWNNPSSSHSHNWVQQRLISHTVLCLDVEPPPDSPLELCLAWPPIWTVIRSVTVSCKYYQSCPPFKSRINHSSQSPEPSSWAPEYAVKESWWEQLNWPISNIWYESYVTGESEEHAGYNCLLLYLLYLFSTQARQGGEVGGVCEG